ncbi:MAG: ERCC4 domain-containing protein [Candidatus Pacearchaeota archaeon]
MPFQDVFSNHEIIREQKEKPKIIVDIREKQSLIPSCLIENGCDVEFKTLYIGDYIVKSTIIERKTINDFISSMLKGRLNMQLNTLKNQKNKLLLIEGFDEQELYNSGSKINENAIRGYLLSILLNYKIPILYTKDYEDSAKFLKILSLKQKKEKEIRTNHKPKPKNMQEQLQYLVEGFPNIGPKTAKKLFEEFSTFKNIINTPIEKLEKTIGKKAQIFKISEYNYKTGTSQ